MAYVTVINEHHYVQQIVSGHHHWVADEPASAGGSGAGPAPYELLLGSLGACTAMALRSFGRHQAWELGKITVGLRFARDEHGREHVDRKLSFGKPLTADQKKRLLEVAGSTPVTQTLSRSLEIRSSMLD